MPDSSCQTSGSDAPPASAPVALAAMAVAIAMLLGGSGSLVPAPEILLQCLLAALTAAWAWMRPNGLRAIPRGAWIIAAVMVAVPLGQLLPLPPVIWHNLPGRSIEQAALALVGQDSTWRPLSLTANRTLAALLVMTAAATLLVMTAAQNVRGRMVLMGTMAGIALLSVLVGAGQLSGGADNAYRFYNPDEAFVDGFQTNHNAQADVLLIGLVALAGTGSDWAERRRRQATVKPSVNPRLMLGVVGGGSMLLGLGVVLTASRTGIALLPIAVGAQVLILHRWLRVDRRRLGIAAGTALVVLVALAVVPGGHGPLAVVWARFHTTHDSRPEIWRDSLYVLRQYWPWGAGMGSFIPVFTTAERLDVVTDHVVNRAHDDYLEFLIESGFPGILAFGVICQQLAKDAWRNWRQQVAGPQAQIICGMASLIIITVHSLGDYPLRTMSIACMAAVCAGFLLPVTGGAKGGS